MLKEILDIAKKIGRDIDDTLFFTDSDPEHIAAFPYHKPGCSQTQPLKITFEGSLGGIPWGGLPADPGGGRRIFICNECGGKEE